jgi:hypothetical protein
MHFEREQAPANSEQGEGNNPCPTLKAPGPYLTHLLAAVLPTEALKMNPASTVSQSGAVFAASAYFSPSQSAFASRILAMSASACARVRTWD